MAGNEVPNKNAAGGQSRLRPFWMEKPTGGDGAHAANAGEKFSSSWLNLPESGNVDFSKYNPDKPAMSLEEQFPAGMSLHAKNPPAELDSTQARTAPPLQLFNDPKKVGKTPAYRFDGGSYQAPQQSVAQAPVAQMSKSTILPLDKPPTSSAPDGSRSASAGEGMLASIMKYFTSPAPPPRWKQYVEPMPVATNNPYGDMATDTMKGKAAPTQAPEGIRAPAAPNYGEGLVNNAINHYSLPNPDGFSQFLAKEAAGKAAAQQQAQQPAAAKNPNQALDKKVVRELEDLSNPVDRRTAPKPEPTVAEGPVVSDQTPDSYAMGTEEDTDPALEGPAGGPLRGQSQFGFDLAETPPSDQVPIGEHPIDEDVMTGVLAGKTPTPETPEEEDRIAYLQSKRGINEDRELAGQDDIRAQIARLQGYSQMDYRPLAALVDTWTGSKMAPHFAGPIDREPLIAQLNAAIQKGNQHMSDADMQELKDYEDNQTRLAVAGMGGKGTGSDKVAAATTANDRRVEAARLAVENRVKAAALAAAEAYKRTQLVTGGRDDKLREDRSRDDIKQDDALKLRMSEGTDANHATNLAGVGRALVKYRDLLHETGVSIMGGFLVATPKQKALQTAYQNVFTEIAKEKKLGQLTTTDNSQVTGSLGGPSGTIGLVEWLRPGAQAGLEAQIQQGLDYIASTGEADIARLRSTAGHAHPSTHDYIDNLESEISMSVGGTKSEAKEIARLRKATREMNSLNPPERKK